MSDPVLDLLRNKNIEYKISGKDYVTKCLSPDHDDSNPSFRIDKVTGISHCFSCGFKTNIFKFYGLVDNFASIKIAKLKEKLNKLSVSSNGVPMPDGATPFTKVFRGISINTLRHFGAFYTNKSGLEDRIFFPITDIRGKNSVYVGRHLLSNGNPRYLNYPSGVVMNPFPIIMAEKSSSLVLVEGMFDLLNVFDKGLKNVACTFGTNTLFNDTATRLLPYRTQGVSHIYLMFDGDKAGNDAANKLKPIIEEAGYIVEIITLEDDSDPGELSQEYIDSIKDYINGKQDSDN